jgi:hypothetical protein
VGSTRIRLELLKGAERGLVVPSEHTIDRILHRQGLMRSRPAAAVGPLTEERYV